MCTISKIFGKSYIPDPLEILMGSDARMNDLCNLSLNLLYNQFRRNAKKKKKKKIDSITKGKLKLVF